jgi:penicillin-binding protein 2
MANTAGTRNIDRRRLQLTYFIMAILLVMFIARLFSLQIIEGDYYRGLADENRFSNVNIAAPRGVIYDRNGVQLVRNIPAFNVYITAAYLPDSEAEQEIIFHQISDLTGVPLDQEGPPAAPCVPGRGVRQLVLEGSTNKPYDPWPIACDVDPVVARVLREMQVDMPGVSVQAVPVREYTTGALTANLIGYMVPIPATLEEYLASIQAVIRSAMRVSKAATRMSSQAQTAASWSRLTLPDWKFASMAPSFNPLPAITCA